MVTLTNKGRKVGLVEIELWLIPEISIAESGNVYVMTKDGEAECTYISPIELQVLYYAQSHPEYWDEINFPVTGGLLRAIREESIDNWAKRHKYGVFYNGDVSDYADITEKVQFVKCCASPRMYRQLCDELEQEFI